jgi:predicted dehydrogenase
MIDAAIVGLGRWGKALVEGFRARSGGLRFISAVSRDPDSHAQAAKSGKRISDV